MDYLFLIIGLGLLLAGANYLVDASVAIARRAKISSFIIGLTIVGIGTSAPELFISISSAVTGHGDIAMGNVVGSNICNTFLILGVTALILPFPIEREQRKRDIPFGIIVALLLLLLANDSLLPNIETNTVSRLDGALLLLLFVLYMCYVIIKKAKNPDEAIAESDEAATSSLEGKNVLLLWLIAAVSLAALLYGGDLFLDAAQNIAKAWGMSEAVISITIVAIGTSLPELITAVIAAIKHNPQLALGNVVGSSLFNILMITGVAAVIHPFEIVSVKIPDFIMCLMAAVAIYVTVFTFGKNKFDRIEGGIFLLVYIAYTVYLLMR